MSEVTLGKTSSENEGFNSGIARKWGGGLPMPEFFGTFFPPSNFHHTRKTLFLSAGKRTMVPELGGGGGGLANSGNARIKTFIFR